MHNHQSCLGFPLRLLDFGCCLSRFLLLLRKVSFETILASSAVEQTAIHRREPIIYLSSFRHVSDTTITVCSADGNTTCTGDGNRVCLLNTTSSEESCGNCAFGYIEFQGECIFIEDINVTIVTQIIETYAPQLSARNVTDAVRVARLKLLAQVVSYFNSLVPPVRFQLGLNKYSLDVEEERAQLLGTFAKEGSSDALPRYDFGGRRRSLQDDPLPLKVDWNEAGAMTDVKDQGRCGCW